MIDTAETGLDAVLERGVAAAAIDSLAAWLCLHDAHVHAQQPERPAGDPADFSAPARD